MGCSNSTKPEWVDRDDERHPRNAAAIRTALMLGAEFQHGQDVFGREVWSIKGVEAVCRNRTMPAWLFLATHGICITKDARPCLCKDIHHEDIR